MQEIDNLSFTIRLAEADHLLAAKRLADQYKQELGFINRAILQKAIETRALLVALPGGEQAGEVAGLVHFYVRRDQVITLYSIAVASAYQGKGLGHQLFAELVNQARVHQKSEIRLKCPVELPANDFYARLGLQLAAHETGKHRALNVWTYILA